MAYTNQPLPLILPGSFEVVLDTIVDILTSEEAQQRALAVESGKAQGSLTLLVNPLDGEDFSVGAKTYTLQATLTNVDGNIQLGPDLATTQANILVAINLSGTPGVEYAALMTVNTSATIAEFSSSDIAILTAIISGVVGNNVATTENFSDTSNVFDDITLGTTRLGVDIIEDQWGFNVVKEIHNPITANDDDFKRPTVNISYASGDLGERSKTSISHSATYSIDIYTQENTTADEEGLSIASGSANRVARQILKILKSPKYRNLRLKFKDDDGNLIKFIEKLSLSSIKKIFTKEPLPKENVAIAQIIFTVDMIENIADLIGVPLLIVSIDVTEPIT